MPQRLLGRITGDCVNEKDQEPGEPRLRILPSLGWRGLYHGPHVGGQCLDGLEFWLRRGGENTFGARLQSADGRCQAFVPCLTEQAMVDRPECLYRLAGGLRVDHPVRLQHVVEGRVSTV